MDKEETVSEVRTGHDPLNDAQQMHSWVSRKDSIEKLIEKEKQVDRYIQNGRKDLAVTLLYDLIISYAQIKNFSRAEDLREKLMRVDSMALSEIVNSAEIIEEKKSEIIDARQCELWNPLFRLLTTEESNAVCLGGVTSFL